jgi:hypothetical protein
MGASAASPPPRRARTPSSESRGNVLGVGWISTCLVCGAALWGGAHPAHVECTAPDRAGAGRADRQDHLTKAMAEREMRRRMEAEQAIPVPAERITVLDAGERLITHLEALGRRTTTMNAYRAALRTHLSPFSAP